MTFDLCTICFGVLSLSCRVREWQVKKYKIIRLGYKEFVICGLLGDMPLGLEYPPPPSFKGQIVIEFQKQKKFLFLLLDLFFVLYVGLSVFIKTIFANKTFEKTYPECKRQLPYLMLAKISKPVLIPIFSFKKL